MENFNYHRPAKVADAVKLMKKARDGKFLGGGHTLIPTMRQGLAQPSDVIDLGGLNQASIKVTAKSVVIGGGTTHAAVASDKGVRKAIPGLAMLASAIGDPHVRHRGTIGGSVANNDPAADYPAACLALGAIIHTDARKIPAEKFFTGLFSTALKDSEIITAVEFPLAKKSGYAKFPNPASRYAMVGVFVAQDAKGGARVAVTGAGPGVFRQADMEAALGKSFKPEALAGITVKSRGLNADLHGSAEYRAHLIGVMARRAVTVAK